MQPGLDPKEEHALEDWVALIAREEAAGNAAIESQLRKEFLQWETRSKRAPNGKWRGANSRKWGKVGIEMRLTGSVPRTEGPQTLLGKMVCKFVDVVEPSTSHVHIASGSGQEDNSNDTETAAPQASVAHRIPSSSQVLSCPPHLS